MGVMMSRDEDRSELNRRISADLRARAQSERRHDPDCERHEENRPFYLDLDCFDRIGDYFAVLYFLYLILIW